MYKMLERITAIAMIMALAGCSGSVNVAATEDYQMTLDARLERNDDGYYSLTVIDNGTQTIHRISGQVTLNNEPLEYQRVVWESSHSWILSDSVAFIVRRDHCPASKSSDTQCIFIVNGPSKRDTVYLSQFEGIEVPTVNEVSISNPEGEINTVFAPIYAMKGDTVRITATALFPTGDVEKSIDVILR